MAGYSAGIRIYNLFPRLLGPMYKWIEHLERIKSMEFDWVFVNPFQYPGFSGSLYAIKDYYKFNPLFLADSASDGWKELDRFILAAHRLGLKVMMDLVVNHTALDSDLTKTHPDWYLRNFDGSIKHPYCIDPTNASKVTVWGDLAEINNVNSPDRKGLWDYWDKLVRTYIEKGIDGFRCDAAYQVPGQLWEYLIGSAKKIKPTLFFAETLGCTEDKLVETAKSGFDYITNSSKWWDFTSDWCLKQNDLTRDYVFSVSFPETHDTPRLAEESQGNMDVSKYRYLFASLFSSGVMMPIGFEYGFQRRLNVVHSMPSDWEEPKFDLTDFIQRTNQLKTRYKVFNEDNLMRLTKDSRSQVVALKKISIDGKQSAWLIINKDEHHYQTLPQDIKTVLQNKDIKEVSPDNPQGTGSEYFLDNVINLKPCQIRVFVT
jgi:starch synthase (maltosyl-transferring)